jgi:DNA-binding MarR family transcriptional regulator
LLIIKGIDDLMDDAWSSYRLAEELLRVMPSFGRLMAHCVNEGSETDATMMQMTMLFHLQHQPMTASEIAKKRRVSLQAASVFVQGLVERGWVVRVPNPKDRRQFLLEVTAEGAERAAIARNHLTTYLAEFLKGLSAEEIAAAGIFLPALYQLLQKQAEVEVSQTEEAYNSEE